MHFPRKNLLDDSFVKCFAPIHVLQAFLGSSRINIKNNSVTYITLEQKLYTFIWIIGFSVSFAYFVLHFYKIYYDKDTILQVTHIIGAFIQYASYLCNIIHVRFFENVSSNQIYHTIQRIDDILLLKHYKSLSQRQFYWNIIYLITIIFPFECGFALYVVMIVEYPLLTIFWAMGLLITYIELLLIGSLIYYLTLRLKYLNKIIEENVAAKSNLVDLDKFLLSLKEILKSYKMITDVFSFTVFNVAATTFTWTLVIIEAIAESLKCSEIRSDITIITISLWIVYYFVLLTALALTSDTFIEEVRTTKMYCIQVLSYRFEGPIHKGANEILRTIQFKQPEFSVYGIFVLNKCLPLKLIGIITTNVVVLIQFTM
ncbi:uncharacterized protein LOC142974210 [Anticarsia gemmatalis]|uniref:uncharacterized protein LOC142974210 n=1 Tax=Anticarsia gemmatalis TaxID=129554 RepID=UPI003F76954E